MNLKLVQDSVILQDTILSIKNHSQLLTNDCDFSLSIQLATNPYVYISLHF
jgi:hypothetical protein